MRKLQPPDVRAQIIEWLDALCSREEIARRLGCDHATIIKEMKLDPDFSHEVKEAERRARDTLVRNVQTAAGRGELKGSIFLLQTKYHEEFGPRSPGTYTSEDFLLFSTRLTDVVRKYVDANDLPNFASEIEAIMADLSKDKK